MTEEGFVFVAKNREGREFIIAASFGKTRYMAKKHLKGFQNKMCEIRRPMFEIVGLYAVRIEAVYDHEPAI